MDRTPTEVEIRAARTAAETVIGAAERTRAAERRHNRPGRAERLQAAIDALAEPGRALASISAKAKPHGLNENRQAAPVRALAKRLNVERDKLRRML